MNLLEEYLKIRKLHEDTILSNEDDGGAPIGGGEVAAPSSAPTPSDVISPDQSIKPDGALQNSDVLGHCDHKKDGCLGPGCFHLPYPVFPVYSRLPKKKKRKYQNLTEGEDSDKQNFIKYTTKIVHSKLEEITKELKKIDPDLKAVFCEDYDFEPHGQWIAAYAKDEQTSIKEFPISVNLGDLYEFLYEEGLELDDIEIDIQLTISIWHEIGHALIQYLHDNEEQLCEELGKFHASKYTGVKKSILQKFINTEYSSK